MRKKKIKNDVMQPAYDLQYAIKNFNENRQETQFQKIKKITEENPLLGKSMDFNKFINGVV